MLPRSFKVCKENDNLQINLSPTLEVKTLTVKMGAKRITSIGEIVNHLALLFKLLCFFFLIVKPFFNNW